MAVVPDVPLTTEEVKIEDIQLDPTSNTPEEVNRLRNGIWRFKHLLIGKGNALPPAAIGVVCDIDVGGARSIAQKVRKAAPQFREKLSDLIKGLLNAKIIRFSTSPWASPTVILIKKNSEDIRLCIDYRLVNSLTRLMVYPMPLINELLENLDKMLWYCSLDMASGFWVVTMTDRARAISAFITPFGLFEWNRMPFGLKNAPQIYQRPLDNALYGFTRIPRRGGESEATYQFEKGEPSDRRKASVLGRRSNIDDILVPAPSWDQLCDRVDALLRACDQWNLSISVVKSYWEMDKVDYLGHRVSKEGLEANPKDLSSLTDLRFPGSLRAMQSFLGSLNYYSRFIEDYAIYAVVLYELREVDFAAMKKPVSQIKVEQAMQIEPQERLDERRDLESSRPAQAEYMSDQVKLETDHGAPSHDRSVSDEVQGLSGVELRWVRAHRAFERLKGKIATTRTLRHFDPNRPATVVVYASDWAISASLMQEYDRIYYPINFISRTLKPNEINYGVVEKEILALLRVLDLNYKLLVGRPIRILTRYSTLVWLFKSAGLQGRLGQWAALLSPWTLEIVKCSKGEDEILGILAASITPRSKIDETLTKIAPMKEPRRQVQAPISTVEAHEELYVVNFDGSARVKRGGGAYSAILWKLPGWTVMKARSGYAESLTVNEAEYRGLLLGLELLQEVDPKRLEVCGDSNLVVRQVRGEIDCMAPGLTLLRRKVLDQLQKWPDHDVVHAKRDWNTSSDSPASAALQHQCGVLVEGEARWQDLVTLNRLDEVIVIRSNDKMTKVSAMITRSRTRTSSKPQILQEDYVKGFRIDRIRQAQDEEAWIAGLKKYLVGELRDLDQGEAKSYSLIATDYETDLNDLLFYCPPTKRTDEDRDGLMRLVMPEALHQDILHHYHASLEGGHQGINRTYQRSWDRFHWRGLYKSVQRYVGECVDCETGKGRPTISGESPGNIQATHPFQIIAMDHIPSLPRSHKGNTELLIWVDMFTGYVIAKASGSRTAQTIAESYEECVFRHFGASEMIRHDREPGFMSDFFARLTRSWDRDSGPRWLIALKLMDLRSVWYRR
ncbi:hypothetical protein PI125_g23174 [Phytophthora idaei]|nr:hypothetical protein PI125_g23174 [Phytophthora idaei]